MRRTSPIESTRSAITNLLVCAGRPFAEISRRTRLARRPGPAGISGPPVRLLVGEVGSLPRYRGKIASVPQARNPQAVMLLPGFAAHPRRMHPLYDALERAGHEVAGWGLGFNLGPTPDNFDFLMRRVASLSSSRGAPITLVGWSLGGLLAREIACRQPEHVSRIITMGTPFSGNPRSNNAWRAYQFITGRAVDDPPIERSEGAKPPVQTIALWSPRDGIVRPRCAAGWPHERDRAVALRCTHLGFAGCPEVVAQVLRQLDTQD